VKWKEGINLKTLRYRNKKLGLYGLISDQSPRWGSFYHWNKFMGIEVPIHTGGEMLSKKYDMNVIFLRTRKLKRGFYEAELEVISENAKDEPNYEITDRFLKLVEQQIYEKPENYLWTHKRWKHRKLS
jgi:KDO2-lipid IV(A) lauroyltransferase